VSGGAAATVSVGGRCRFCGCGADCRLSDGDECGWVDARRECCSKPSCIKAAMAARGRGRKAQPRPSSAEIHDLIRRKGRKGRKGKKGRAA
jgi:hypothetical protein